MPQDSIEELRKEIEKIDDQILSLAAKRMQLAEKCRTNQKKATKPIKNFAVEKRIIERMREKSEELGTYKDLGEGLLKTLIEYHVKDKNEIYHSNLTPSEKTQKLTIIGGSENMGKWSAEFSHTLGHRVTIQDRIKSDDINPDWRFKTDLEESIKDAGVIILATPMMITNEILKEIADINSDAIVIELCSLKSPVKEGVEYAQSKGVKLLSSALMFGPNTEFLSGKNLILCETSKNDPSLRKLKIHLKHSYQSY